MVQGRVRVNGKVVTTPGARIRPDEDRVEVDGREVEQAPFRWVLLHKPAGTITTADDPRGRRTVFDVLPEELHGLSYVGRLDRDTEGLLLLSNEGDAVHRMLHPGFEVEREYHAGVYGVPDDAALGRLRRGVELEDGPAAASDSELLRTEQDGGVVRLVLTEGRKREVRRMLYAVGHPVRWLRRVRFGPVELGDLPPGEWRELSDGEVRAIRERVGRSAP